MSRPIDGTGYTSFPEHIFVVRQQAIARCLARASGRSVAADLPRPNDLRSLGTNYRTGMCVRTKRFGKSGSVCPEALNSLRCLARRVVGQGCQFAAGRFLAAAGSGRCQRRMGLRGLDLRRARTQGVGWFGRIGPSFRTGATRRVCILRSRNFRSANSLTRFYRVASMEGLRQFDAMRWLFGAPRLGGV